MEALTAFNRQLLSHVVKPLAADGKTPDVAEMMRALTANLAGDPQRSKEIQERYYQQQLALWMHFAAQPPAAPAAPIVEPEPGDRRFRAPEWQQPYFSFLAQSYLLNARFLTELVESAELDPKAKRKLRFYARQYIDAMSPANFPWSNPEAIKLAAESKGESVARGLKNLAGDLERGLVSMTDPTAFDVGRNLAVTPGAVVYENDFMQLIQYRPADGHRVRAAARHRAAVHQQVLHPRSSAGQFVRPLRGRTGADRVHRLVAQHARIDGHRRRGTTISSQGVISALDTAREICGSDKVNALGFCVGGTLLGCALAVRRAQGDDRVASLTLLTTMLDFSETGELSIFVDEPYVAKRERDFARGGLMPGRELAITFASLRANDLIWQYVVNNYLKGRTPDPFDLLYWNSDSTNLPGAMYAYYVRNMYLDNHLRTPRKLTMCGVPVDLRKVDMPAYVLASREDHIVPWTTAYDSARLLRGQIVFVLAASGHIAGVINPASRNRRNYWLGGKLPKDPEAWLRKAESHPGSWWTHWAAWLAKHGGARIPARTPGSAEYPEIEPAPGRYVKEKA